MGKYEYVVEHVVTILHELNVEFNVELLMTVAQVELDEIYWVGYNNGVDMSMNARDNLNWDAYKRTKDIIVKMNLVEANTISNDEIYATISSTVDNVYSNGYANGCWDS